MVRQHGTRATSAADCGRRQECGAASAAAAAGTASWQPDYRPGFLTSAAAAELFDAVLTHADWHAETVRLFGRAHTVPRRVAWYGARGLNYRYSGNDHVAAGWPDFIREPLRRVGDALDADFNFVLINHYRDGSDSIGWHVDDEPALTGSVASISLGATRRFLIRPPAAIDDAGDAAGRRSSIRLDLADGSLLALPVESRLAHCLPRTRRFVAARISLGFRCVTLGRGGAAFSTATRAG